MYKKYTRITKLDHYIPTEIDLDEEDRDWISYIKNLEGKTIRFVKFGNIGSWDKNEDDELVIYFTDNTYIVFGATLEEDGAPSMIYFDSGLSDPDYVKYGIDDEYQLQGGACSLKEYKEIKEKRQKEEQERMEAAEKIREYNLYLQLKEKYEKSI